MSFEAFASSGGTPSPAAAESTPTTVTPDTSSQAQDSVSDSSVDSGSSDLSDDTSSEETSSLVQDPEAPAEETPAYEPNFKFKVMDQEHEMDEYFRQFVKTAEDEKKFREIYEKAFGLDVVKPKFQATRERLQATETQLGQVNSTIQELQHHYKNGDFDKFFDRMGISEEKVLQWVINKAQYNQLPPDQRKAFDDQRASRDKAYQLERQMADMRQQYETQAAQAKVQGLQVALEKPDVKSVAQAYDAKKGAGSFQKEIIAYGDYVWKSTQGRVDLTPEQAVQAVMERFTVFGAPGTQSQPQTGTRTATPPVIPAGKTPAQAKTIPNLQGRSSTQVGKSKPKSLADLKKLADSMG